MEECSSSTGPRTARADDESATTLRRGGGPPRIAGERGRPAYACHGRSEPVSRRGVGALAGTSRSIRSVAIPSYAIIIHRGIISGSRASPRRIDRLLAGRETHHAGHPRAELHEARGSIGTGRARR